MGAEPAGRRRKAERGGPSARFHPRRMALRPGTQGDSLPPWEGFFNWGGKKAITRINNCRNYRCSRPLRISALIPCSTHPNVSCRRARCLDYSEEAKCLCCPTQARCLCDNFADTFASLAFVIKHAATSRRLTPYCPNRSPSRADCANNFVTRRESIRSYLGEALLTTWKSTLRMRDSHAKDA